MPKYSTAKYNEATLLAVAERLEGTTAALRALAATLKVHGIPEIELKRQTELERGMKGVENFAHAARITFYERLAEVRKKTGAAGGRTD